MSLTSNGIDTEDPGAVPGASTKKKLYMIYVRDEGQKIKNGINFYPLSSNHVGFVIRLYNNAKKLNARTASNDNVPYSAMKIAA